MKNSFFRSTACLAFVLAVLTPALTTPVYAEKESASCVFVSLHDSAWISHQDSDVKGTLKVGDVLREGDKVTVTHGNKVQLAFDKECKNIVQVEGDSSFTLRSISPAKVSLQKGKIFSMLDNLPAGSRFLIETPTAVAAVRGTQYQVNTTGIESNILVYRGAVEVHGRTLDGELTEEQVILSAGDKSSVSEAGKAPGIATKMSDAENEEISPVLQNVEQTRQSIKPEQIQAWLDEKSIAAAGSEEKVFKKASSKDSDKDSDEKTKSDKGLVVL